MIIFCFNMFNYAPKSLLHGFFSHLFIVFCKSPPPIIRVKEGRLGSHVIRLQGQEHAKTTIGIEIDWRQKEGMKIEKKMAWGIVSQPGWNSPLVGKYYFSKGELEAAINDHKNEEYFTVLDSWIVKLHLMMPTNPYMHRIVDTGNRSIASPLQISH